MSMHCVFLVTVKHCEFSLSQVRFHVSSTVLRVATMGDNAGCGCWTKTYRLAYSVDCVAFNNILDGAGNNMVIKTVVF